MPLPRTALACILPLAAACATLAPAPLPCPRLAAVPSALPDTQVYDSLTVTQRAERISSPAFRYPDSARQLGLNGRVVVDVIIDPEGRAEPASLKLVSASDSVFVAPTFDVIKKSRFCPAERDGKRVRQRLLLPMNFEIHRMNE